MAAPGDGTSEHTPGELKAQQAAAIVEFSADAIVGKDLTGLVTSWNPGADRRYGYTEAEMIGRPIHDLVPGDGEEDHPLILARPRRGEAVARRNTVRRRRDGTRIDVALSISAIRDAPGRVQAAAPEVAVRTACDPQRTW
ncbi:MAG: PAS domain S-box protein [Ilumatobacteraceae bacterium]